MLHDGQTDLPPIFIIGSPRSGTTMLAGLLQQTPWGEPFETHFITKYHRRLRRYGDLTTRPAFVRLAADILAERPIDQHKPGIDPNQMFEALEVHSYASLAHAVGLACARRHGTRSWGDKTPQYVTDVDLLHALFPESRMILIVRDGRDVALSLMERNWGPANVFSCARQWRNENEPRAILDVMRAKGLLFDVRYEDMLADPIATLAEIMRFLGQEAAPDMLHSLTRGLRQHNGYRWKREMSSAQVATFDGVAGDTLRRLGYEAGQASRPVSLAQEFALRAHDSAKHWRHLFVMNVIDTVKIRAFGKEPFAE